MKTRLILLSSVISLLLCTCHGPVTRISPWVPYDESDEIARNASHASPKMRYQLIQSRISDRNEVWKNVSEQLRAFNDEDYQRLKPLILEQDIPALQSHIASGELTYGELTQWYLYRIVMFENNPATALNNIISINPDAVSEARARDKHSSRGNHPLYGIPVLLKDNIGLDGLPTTAGAAFLANNMAPDAFIVERIKEKGGIILGKVNLSEWANYLSSACPNGYSAVGGQTLNPYGRRKFDTGGSSSGSGTAVSACYAAVAVGTETSGSILSPSSANSVVGLKPTVGLLSRSGIVPLSGTLDTPGPMTRNVTDNAILLSAMCGKDPDDAVTRDNPGDIVYWEDLSSSDISGLRFGIIRSFMADSLYRLAVEKIRSMGATCIEFEPPAVTLRGFSTLLSADMKKDLPAYLEKYASSDVPRMSVQEIMSFNSADSVKRIPYGQTIFRSMAALEVTPEELDSLRIDMHAAAVSYFNTPMTDNNLDAILSVGNRSASMAAAAFYPCLTVPMGYRANGEPVGLTFIAKPYSERNLLRMGYAYEQATRLRKTPEEIIVPGPEMPRQK
ncbi:MAG: amidase family protein [Bacteroidota bacterium]|nr:amidase family protein [Bacteroidota bacterium]